MLLLVNLNRPGARGRLTMAALVLAVAMALAATASAMEFTADDVASEESMAALYERWCALYGGAASAPAPAPARDPGEKARRFLVFKENARRAVDRFKSGRGGDILGLNGFGDLTYDEIRLATACVLGPIPWHLVDNKSAIATHAGDLPLLLQVDHRRSRILPSRPPCMTKVKNQMVNYQGNGVKCGSCWTFAVAAAVECANCIHTDMPGAPESLSAQMLVDCDTRSQGCTGGFIDSGLKFIYNDHGLVEDREYPYLGIQESCRPILLMTPTVLIDGVRYVPANNEEELMRAVASQPVAVVIFVGEDFSKYTGGIFSGPCGSQAHAVLVVGYGFTDNQTQDFWIIKNSWGENWGEGGYMRMKRGGGGPKEGLCRILEHPVYPVKKDKPVV